MAACSRSEQTYSFFGAPSNLCFRGRAAVRRQTACLRTCPFVHLDSHFPRGPQCTCQYILVRRSETDMGVSHLPPSARNGHENLRRLLDECGLLLPSKHQVSITPGLRGQRSKFSTADAKGWEAGVGILFHALKA